MPGYSTTTLSDLIKDTEIWGVALLILSHCFCQMMLGMFPKNTYKLIADSAGMELHYWLVNDAPQSVVEWLLTLGIQVHTNIPGW